MTVLHITQPYGPPNPPAPVDDVPCCMGSAVWGPDLCTCWEPVLSSDQAPVQEGPNLARPRCCGDCAYLNGSRERADDVDLPTAQHLPFWCHTGMVHVVAWRHPDGRETTAGAGDYRPAALVDGLAPRDRRKWMADGRPAQLCGGWAAHARARTEGSR